MSDEMLLGVVVGCVIAGFVGYVSSQILFHTDTMGRFTRPQVIPLTTQLTPAQVFWRAIRSAFGLFVIISSGSLVALMFYAVLVEGRSDLSWFLIVELVILVGSLVTFRFLPFLLIFILSLIQAFFVYLVFNWDIVFGFYYY